MRQSFGSAWRHGAMRLTSRDAPVIAGIALIEIADAIIPSGALSLFLPYRCILRRSRYSAFYHAR